MNSNIQLEVQHDRLVYGLAKEYLLKLPGITSEILDQHISPTIPRATSLTEIYRRLLESAQNAGMMSRVISGTIGGINSLGPVLCKFDPLSVTRKFSGDWQEVYYEIGDKLKPRGEFRPTGLWRRFCKSILSGAGFLARFDQADDFHRWVAFFDESELARPALPMILSYEIDGFGFALACDFIKELVLQRRFRRYRA